MRSSILVPFLLLSEKQARERVSLGNALLAACWIRTHSLDVKFTLTQNLAAILQPAAATPSL
jgi:hypothetical protein